MEQHQNISLVSLKGLKRPGALSISPEGFEWKGRPGKDGKVPKDVTVSTQDVAALSWAPFADGFELRITIKGNTTVVFQGFKKQVTSEIENWAAKADKPLEIVKRSFAGYNWGDLNIKGSHLAFSHQGGSTAFELPVSSLSQTAIQGKNEISLEFHHDDIKGDELCLVEMRMYVPPATIEKETKDGNKEEISTLQALHQELSARTDTGAAGSEVVATFKELSLLVPRARAGVEMFSTYLKLHASFHYKIAYKSISQMILLDMPDIMAKFFVLGLSPPIRQGQTSYPYLLIQFKADDEKKVLLNMDEKEIAEKYPGLLAPVMQGNLYDIVTRTFKAMTGRKLIGAAKSYLSMNHSKCVRTSYKANDGHLFMLEKSFFFLKKPMLYIRHDEIEAVACDRLKSMSNAAIGSSKTFDLVLHMKGGQGTHSFMNINRNEYDNLVDFIVEKKITYPKLKQDRAEFSSSGYSDGKRRYNYADSDDPYLSVVQAEGGGGMGGDEDSEEDEDYNAPSDESSDDEDEPMNEVDPDEIDPSVKVKKGKAKRKKGSDDEDDEEDEEEDEEPKKKSKKAKESKGKKDKGEKKETKKKDKTGPKRAQNAYMFFANEQRDTVKKDHPEMSPVDVTRELGQRWNALADKSPYNQMAEQDKQRYKDELANMPEGAESAKSSTKATKGKGKKKEKKEGEPKKALPAYMFFSSAMRKEMKEELAGKGGEATKIIGAKWKGMSDEEKEPYFDMHKKDKERYEEEYDAWRSAASEKARAEEAEAQ